MPQNLQQPTDLEARHALQLITVLQKSLSELSESISTSPTGATEYDASSLARVKAGFGALEANLTPSFTWIHGIGWLYHVPIALGIVVELGWAELVTEMTMRNPNEGVSAQDLEIRTGVPWSKISRLLRLLCGRGFFTEVRPDVFAHTRHSRALDSGLPYSEAVKDPLGRFAKGTPCPALAHHWCGEVGIKSAVALFDVFKDDDLKRSFEPDQSAFHKALHTDLPFWTWMETVDEGARVKSFMNALSGTATAGNNPDHSRYPWHELGPQATVVDVGGAIGSAMASILPHAPNVTKAIVQDRKEVIEGAVQPFWEQMQKEDPDSFPPGRIEFQAIDFFVGQPVKRASAYFLRYILHDWPDDACVTILKHIHDAAGPKSRLLIEDVVLDHACRDVDAVNHVPGAYDLSSFSPPLPANGGLVAEPDLQMDIQMMAVVNGQERTHIQRVAVASRAGWRARRVYPLGAGSLKISEFTKE